MNVVITALRGDSGELRGFAKVTRDLTPRRSLEEALRRSEERFRLLVEGVVDYAIYMINPQGYVTTCNSGAQRMKGYCAHEILGKNFAVFFPEEDVQSGKPLLELEIARSRGRFEVEGWRVRKDGSKFWANVVVNALHSDHGEFVGFAKVTRDLTNRRESEETARKLLQEQAARQAAEAAEGRVRESEERHRALSGRLEVILEGVADAITAQDRSGHLVFANTAAAKMCGVTSPRELVEAPPEEVLGRFEILDEQGNRLESNDLPGRRVLHGEQPGSTLMRVRDKRTSEQWWSLARACECGIRRFRLSPASPFRGSRTGARSTCSKPGSFVASR